MPRAIKVKPRGDFIRRLIAESPAKTIERFANDSGIAEKLVSDAAKGEMSTPSAIWRIAEHLKKHFQVIYDDLVEPPDINPKESAEQSHLTMVLTCTLHMIGDLSQMQQLGPVVIQKHFEALLSSHVSGEMAFVVKEIVAGSTKLNVELNDATLDALLTMFFRRMLACMGVTGIRVYSVLDFHETLLRVAAAERVQIGDNINVVRDFTSFVASKFVYDFGSVYSIGVGAIPPDIVWDIDTNLWHVEIRRALREWQEIAASCKQDSTSVADEPDITQRRKLPFNLPAETDK